ncbi:MAG TPA: hypothetical protein VFW23_02235 [Tepidisphaeraceae bacterium]|nr:hypothetical protein [Tepidisphaeraceae bacterium]
MYFVVALPSHPGYIRLNSMIHGELTGEFAPPKILVIRATSSMHSSDLLDALFISTGLHPRSGGDEMGEMYLQVNLEQV